MFSESDLSGLGSGCGMLSNECPTVSLVLLFACACASDAKCAQACACC